MLSPSSALETWILSLMFTAHALSAARSPDRASAGRCLTTHFNVVISTVSIPTAANTAHNKAIQIPCPHVSQYNLVHSTKCSHENTQNYTLKWTFSAFSGWEQTVGQHFSKAIIPSLISCSQNTV